MLYNLLYIRMKLTVRAVPKNQFYPYSIIFLYIHFYIQVIWAIKHTPYPLY